MPILAAALAFLGAMASSLLTWFMTRAAQRLLVFGVWVVAALVLINTLDSELRSLIGGLATYAPDLGYFFHALAPDNFPALITTIVTVETSLALYRWGYKFISAKAGIS